MCHGCPGSVPPTSGSTFMPSAWLALWPSGPPVLSLFPPHFFLTWTLPLIKVIILSDSSASPIPWLNTASSIRRYPAAAHSASNCCHAEWMNHSYGTSFFALGRLSCGCLRIRVGWVVKLLCRFTLHLAAAPVWCFFHLPKKQSRVLWLPLPVRGSAVAWGHSLMPCRLWPYVGLVVFVVSFRYRAESQLFGTHQE